MADDLHKRMFTINSDFFWFIFPKCFFSLMMKLLLQIRAVLNVSSFWRSVWFLLEEKEG